MKANNRIILTESLVDCYNITFSTTEAKSILCHILQQSGLFFRNVIFRKTAGNSKQTEM